MRFLLSSRVKKRHLFFKPVQFNVLLSDDSVEIVQLFLGFEFFLFFFLSIVFEEFRQMFQGVFFPESDLGGMDFIVRSDLCECLFSFDGGESDLRFFLGSEGFRLLGHRDGFY